MIQISQNTQNIQPSKIRKMFNKALEYEHVLSFTLGEPDFTASENVVEAGCQAIREGKTKYSANAGILELRQAIARYLHRAEGLSYDPASQIIVTAGAMEALFLALKVLLEPGDEVSSTSPAGQTTFSRSACAAVSRSLWRPTPKRDLTWMWKKSPKQLLPGPA